MQTEDLFATAVQDEDGLRSLYESGPSWIVQNKGIDHLDALCREYVAVCRFALVASADREGRADVTPRGGPAGFISVLDDRTPVVPDATGNKRLATFRNVLETGRAGLLMVIPGARSAPCAPTAGPASAPTPSCSRR